MQDYWYPRGISYEVCDWYFLFAGSGNIVSESAFCAMLEDNLPPNFPIYELSFLLFFLIPMLVIIVLYVCIALRIRQRSRHSLGKRVEGVIHGESKHTKTRKSIIRMLGTYPPMQSKTA